MMAELRKSLDMYKEACGSYPTTKQTLSALITPPKEEPVCANWGTKPFWDPKILYYPYTLAWYERLWRWIKSEPDITIPLDYYGNRYVYASDGTTFKFVSFARDGAPGGEGLNMDISSEDI
jgi:general secretion pathway protein G